MSTQRSELSQSQNSPVASTSPQLASRPFVVQTKPDSGPSPTLVEMENQNLEQDKLEATRLEIKQRYGSSTPEEQAHLGTLQAKMSDFWSQQLSQISQHGHSLSTVSIEPHPTRIQPKLSIGAPGDKYEQEADRVAAQVVRQINEPVRTAPPQSVQRQQTPEDEEEVQRKPESKLKPTLRWEIGPPEPAEIRRKPMIQLQTDGGMAATPDLERSIQQSRGSGQAIDSPLRQPLEQAFNADFSGVKIHADGESDRLSRSIQAKAFTTGQDIYFRQGAYDPNSRGGQELIAHELTHVVQQTGDAVRRSVSITSQNLPGVVQLRGSNKRKAERAAERRRTKGNRNQLRRQKLEEAKATQSYMSTLAEWGSWAWDQVTSIGQGAMTRVFGVDPVEISQTLAAVARSNMSTTNKLLYLALYGSYQATEYLKNNLDSIVGGEVGELIKLDGEITAQLEQASKLWEQGGVSESDVEDAVKDQIIDYLAGGD